MKTVTAAGALSLALATWTVLAGDSNIATVTRGFLASLTSGDREAAQWPFNDPERFDVHYAPFGLEGLRHGDLDGPGAQHADQLLRVLLSESGYEKVTAIRLLERDVSQSEGRLRGLLGLRDPGRYFWAFFGEPSDESPWGLRFEGHHLSINVTATPGAPLATTPLFLGAQPRIVPPGFPSAGVSALGEEERIARALYESLDEGQRRVATLPLQHNRGHMIGQVSRMAAPEALGLSRASMSPTTCWHDIGHRNTACS